MNSDRIEVPRLMEEIERFAHSGLVRSNLNLELDCTPGIEPIFTKRQELTHVLLELIINATKFASPGRAVFMARPAVSSSIRGPCLAFVVSDNGPGIPRSILNKIMIQYPIPEVRAQNRNGIGLYMAGKIATVLGGDFSLVSALGKGLTATVTLPAELAEPATSL